MHGPWVWLMTLMTYQPHTVPTDEQVAALRDPTTFAGVYPRVVGQRHGGDLIVDLPYSLDPAARAQGFALITTSGVIVRDRVYSYRHRGFRPDPQLWGPKNGPGEA